MEQTFTASLAPNESLVFFKRHWLPLSMYVFIIGIISYELLQLELAINPFGLSQDSMGFMNQVYYYLISFVLPFAYISPFLGFLNSIFLIGVIKMNLNVVDFTSPKISAYKLPLSVYAKVIFLNVCYTIITAIGFTLLVLPGIFFSIRFMYLSYIVLDNPKCTLQEAFVGSWKMTKENFGSLLMMCIMLILECFSGLIACLIGIIPAYAHCLLTIALSYRMLCPLNKGNNASSYIKNDDNDFSQEHDSQNYDSLDYDSLDYGSTTTNDTNAEDTIIFKGKEATPNNSNEPYIPHPTKAPLPKLGKPK